MNSSSDQFKQSGNQNFGQPKIFGLDPKIEKVKPVNPLSFLLFGSQKKKSEQTSQSAKSVVKSSPYVKKSEVEARVRRNEILSKKGFDAGKRAKLLQNVYDMPNVVTASGKVNARAVDNNLRNMTYKQMKEKFGIGANAAEKKKVIGAIDQIVKGDGGKWDPSKNN